MAVGQAGARVTGSPAETRAYWLLELRLRDGSVYWDASGWDGTASPVGFGPDAHYAIRFQRRDDANKVARLFRGLPLEVSEHLDMEVRSA